ncbi:Rhamnose mutarotase [Kalmanozyma brasiliensis GHG001]|uniref:L-fucose mutarotase n=1 Tax=Kalmanozyma brasiliensis (strain GHG001) TaxID=1365824 RepID=V5EAP5_KALBG|nr:Rhamnose mutarotase [Kalmanozyma brasiliensis GHG001]EST07471.1 Rhamnose mutarotase [Kalmanozyma brasiliensis GHG001]
MVRQEVLLLDIASDPTLVAQYIDHHAPGNVPRPILESIRYPGSGVLNMRIFHFADRLVMIMDVEDDFSFDKKAASDGGNADVEKWETLMERFQREIKDPEGKQTGKWKRAELCFDLSQHF